MRRVLFAAFGTLGACAVNPPAAPAEPVADGPPQIHGVTAGHTCNPAGIERFVGQIPDNNTGPAILRTSNAAVLRWAPPRAMLTMDYREDRVTVSLDEARKITKVRCG